MTEELYAGTKHLTGIGVAHLMRNDTFPNAGLGTHLVEVPAEFADQGFLGAGTGQQPAIGG